MKKPGKGAGSQSRSIRTLSRKEDPNVLKRNNVGDHNTYANINNTSGLFPGAQNDRSGSQVPRGAHPTHSK